MKYQSTRNASLEFSFQEAVNKGLSDEGGLFVPRDIPKVDFASWADLSYEAKAQKVLALYAGESLDQAAVEETVAASLKRFRHPDITPLNSLGSLHILELFHGPTYSFKDVALQMLGPLFERWPGKYEKRTILGATSGDTGSAAIYGMRGRQGMHAFILFPEGRVSEIQELQMTTVSDENIHCLAIRGSFDDCQNLVKECFADASFRDEVSLSAVNSINYSRITAQIVYYIDGYFQWLKATGKQYGESLPCSVPTGNFGDIFAGYLAKLMGLPLDPLIIASNENDILTRFCESGTYVMKDVVPTQTPSMDIQISSNFERLLYLLYQRNDTMIRSLMSDLKEKQSFSVSESVMNDFHDVFQAARVSRNECDEVMRRIYESHGTVVDPHTAIGIGAAEKVLGPGVDVMCLATAHPAKFLPAVNMALSEEQALPEALDSIRDLPQRKKIIDADVEEVKRIVRELLQ